MKKRFLSLFLIAVMLISVYSPTGIAASDTDLQILEYDEEEKDSYDYEAEDTVKTADETVSDGAVVVENEDENLQIKTEEYNGVNFYLDTDGKLYINEISEENRICSEYTITNIFKIDDELCAAVLEGNADVIRINEDGTYSNYYGEVSLYSTTTNRDTIYNFLKNKGLSTAAACGIVANIKYESGYKPTALGDSGTSYGICQWHNSRYTRLKTWCSDNGYSYTTLTGQLNYLWYELNNYYKGTLNLIEGVTDTSTGAYNAAYYWCYYFEVPANRKSVSVTRGNYAKNTIWPIYNVKPGKPTITSIKNSGTGTKPALTVTWSAGSGGTPTSYVVSRKKTGESSYTKIAVTTRTYYEDSGLSSYTKYYYKVTAKNSAGSATSATKSAYTLPAAPTNVTVTRSSSSPTSSLVVSWSKVSSASSYIVMRRIGTSSTYVKAGTTSNTSFTDSGLNAGTKYYYRVYSVRGSLTSVASDTVGKWTKMNAPKASSVGLTSATLSWSAAAGYSGAELKYIIYGKKGTSSSYSAFSKDIEGTTAKSTGLSTGTQYTCYIKVHNTSADTYPTTSQSVTFYTYMKAPTVSTVSGSTTKLKVSWTAVNGKADYRYKVYRRLSGSGNTISLLTTTSSTSYTDSGLKSGTKYDYVIEAVSSSDTDTRLTKSNVTTATTPTIAIASLSEAAESSEDDSENIKVTLMEDSDVFDDINEEDEYTVFYSEDGDEDENEDDSEEVAESTDISCSIDAESEIDVQEDVNYEYPYTINNIKTDSSGITVTFTETIAQNSGVVVLAQYDDSGKMIQFTSVDLSECESGDDGTYAARFDGITGGNLKAFIWDSFDTMKALSVSANIDEFDNTDDDTEEEIELEDTEGNDEEEEID